MMATRTTMSTSRKLFMASSVPTGSEAEPVRMRGFSGCGCARAGSGQRTESGLGAGGVVLGGCSADPHASDDATVRHDRHAAAEDDEPATAVGVQAEQFAAG